MITLSFWCQIKGCIGEKIITTKNTIYPYSFRQKDLFEPTFSKRKYRNYLRLLFWCKKKLIDDFCAQTHGHVFCRLTYMYRSSMSSLLLSWFFRVLCGLGPAVFLTLLLLCSFLTHVFIVIARQCLTWPFHQFLRVGFHISKENSGLCLCWLPVLFTEFIFVFLTNCVQATNYDPKHSKEQCKNGKPGHSWLSTWDT